MLMKEGDLRSIIEFSRHKHQTWISNQPLQCHAGCSWQLMRSKVTRSVALQTEEPREQQHISASCCTVSSLTKPHLTPLWSHFYLSIQYLAFSDSFPWNSPGLRELEGDAQRHSSSDGLLLGPMGLPVPIVLQILRNPHICSSLRSISYPTVTGKPAPVDG